MILEYSQLFSQALIVKFCGKKTPLVRRKRRHRRSVHHEAAPDAEEQVQEQQQEQQQPVEDSVQIHPAVVELSLPFGKKVRLGEKKKSSSNGHSRHRGIGDDLERPGAGSRVLEGVVRATRLAGNLGQRIANMPSGNSSNGETNPIAASDENSSATTSPSKDKRSRSRGLRSGVGIINTKRRPFKSLSPDKRLLAKGLAETVSRSFEKLDLVSPRRIVERKRRKAESQDHERSASADADRGREKRKERKESKVAAAAAATAVAPSHGGKEVTIAKLGKFTFSFEVNNGASKKVSAEMTEQEMEERRKRRERRKKSREEQQKRRATTTTTTEEEKKENEKEILKPKIEPEPDKKIRRPSLIVVSKRQKSDRPLRATGSPEKKASAAAALQTTSTDDTDDFIDYRMTFGHNQRRHKTSKQESFSRSISHPGPPPNVAEIIIAGLESNPNGMKRNNSFAGDKSRRDKSASRLKRSETEKSTGMEWSKRLGGGGGASNGGALLLSPKPAFENRAYDKSPEPKSSKLETQKSESLNYLKSVSDESSHRKTRPSLLSMKSSSVDSPSSKNVKEDNFDFDSDSSLSSNLSDSKRRSPPTQVQSLSEESHSGSSEPRRFENDLSSTSSDSEMEIILGQKTSGPKSVSRSKIIERVVKKESIPETQSRALLLASSLSSSSLSITPSDDECNGKTRRKSQVETSSNVEFIFPGEESSKSPSLQQTSLSVSSLSERYSASSTTSSLASPHLKMPTTTQQKTSKSKNDELEDLDNISILTDGMG